MAKENLSNNEKKSLWQLLLTFIEMILGIGKSHVEKKLE